LAAEKVCPCDAGEINIITKIHTMIIKVCHSVIKNGLIVERRVLMDPIQKFLIESTAIAVSKEGVNLNIETVRMLGT